MRNKSQCCDESEIDLKKSMRVIKKQKKIFFGVFLLTILLCLIYIQMCPRVYRATLTVQLPVVNKVLLGYSPLVSAEKFKGIISNLVFKKEFIKKLHLDLDNNDIAFVAESLTTLNVLKIDIDIVEEKKDSREVILQKLREVISDTYAKLIEQEKAGIEKSIQQNDEAIFKAQQNDENLHQQVEEIENQEDELSEELKIIISNNAKLIDRINETFKNSNNKGKTLKQKNSEDVVSLLEKSVILSNLIDSKSIEQKSKILASQKTKLNIDIEENNSQIIGFHLKKSDLIKIKDYVQNIEIFFEEIVFDNYISPDKKKAFISFLAMGLFLSIFVVFFLGF